MSTFSYPKPKQLLAYDSVNPRPLHPLSPPRTSNGGPSLPVEAARRTNSDVASNIIPGYRLSTHIYRASNPRTKCNIGPTPMFPITIPDRKKQVTAAANHLAAMTSRDVDAVYQEGWPAPENELWVVINRFVSEKLVSGKREKRDNGVTMTFMHANGFHKETWEECLKAAVRQHPRFNETVDEIWLLDSANHGDSALINEGKLGDIFNWQDNARDLLQFLLYYLPEEPGSDIPLHLNAVSDQISKSRRENGFVNRRIIGTGHSLGGTSSCRAALDSPVLFSDLILVDPIIHCASLYDSIAVISLPLSATVGRRVEFPSREEALQSFLKVPFFARWDRRVLQAYVDFAMVEDKGGVRLKTSSYQEAATFAERRLPSEVWELLKELDPRVELHWVMSGKEHGLTGGDDGTPDSPWQRDSTVWRREENSSNIRIKGSGHLVTQTVPDELGNDIGAYVLERYSRGQTMASKL